MLPSEPPTGTSKPQVPPKGTSKPQVPPKDLPIAPQRQKLVKVMHGPVFGSPIEALYSHPKPLFFESCIEYLDKNGLTMEGIYRISGQHTMIQQLQNMADERQHIDLTGIDPHTVASTLKLWLRKLPEPLLTFKLLPQFTEIPESSTHYLESLYHLLLKLPNPNRNALKLLMFHLNRIIAHSKENKMTVNNLEIVFAPTLGFGSFLFCTLVQECKHLFRPESDLVDYYM